MPGSRMSVTAKSGGRSGTGQSRDAPRAVVITCSTRAATGVYEDRGGPLITQALRQWGFDAADPVVVLDGPAVAAALRKAPPGTPAVVLTTGGTGLSPTDGNLAVLDRQAPGIAEAIRAAGVAAGVPSAMLSRGRRPLAGRTLVVNLPGSTGVRDGLAVLEPVLGHAVSQVGGGDH